VAAFARYLIILPIMEESSKGDGLNFHTLKLLLADKNAR
jgi:hypothetical protein